MVVGMIPISTLTAFAATEMLNGYCSVTGTAESGIAVWELSDGTLTIKKSAEGGTKMSSFSASETMRPSWESYKDQINKVIIEDDITSLGSYTFYNYTSLKEVVIGNGIQEVGGLAFYGCTSSTTTYEIATAVSPERGDSVLAKVNGSAVSVAEEDATVTIEATANEGYALENGRKSC